MIKQIFYVLNNILFGVLICFVTMSSCLAEHKTKVTHEQINAFYNSMDLLYGNDIENGVDEIKARKTFINRLIRYTNDNLDGLEYSDVGSIIYLLGSSFALYKEDLTKQAGLDYDECFVDIVDLHRLLSYKGKEVAVAQFGWEDIENLYRVTDIAQYIMKKHYYDIYLTDIIEYRKLCGSVSIMLKKEIPIEAIIYILGKTSSRYHENYYIFPTFYIDNDIITDISNKIHNIWSQSSPLMYDIQELEDKMDRLASIYLVLNSFNQVCDKYNKIKIKEDLGHKLVIGEIILLSHLKTSLEDKKEELNQLISSLKLD